MNKNGILVDLSLVREDEILAATHRVESLKPK
jgi:hypothetical protein